MSSQPPLNDSSHPNQQTAKEVQTTLSKIRETLNQTGTVTAATPIAIQQNNLAASSQWVLGNTTLNKVADSYTVGKFQNGDTCPVNKPFVDTKNTCINCFGETAYNIDSKSCEQCQKIDPVKHVCITTAATPTNQTTNPTNSTNQTTNPTNQSTTIPTNTTNQPTVPVTPVQQITNTQNPSGLLLP